MTKDEFLAEVQSLAEEITREWLSDGCGKTKEGKKWAAIRKVYAKKGKKFKKPKRNKS